MQLLVLTFIHRPPGITKLSSWMQQSQTVCWIAALHANLKNLPRPPQTALFTCAVWGWWHRAAIRLSVYSWRLLGLCSQLHNSGAPCVTALKDSLSALAPLSFWGFSSPDHLLLLFVIPASASRGHQHHMFVLKLDWETLDCFFSVTGQTKRGKKDQLGLSMSWSEF